MTPEEAIRELRDHANLVLVGKNPKLKKAMSMGIEAIERLARLIKLEIVAPVAPYAKDLAEQRNERKGR